MRWILFAVMRCFFVRFALMLALFASAMTAQEHATHEPDVPAPSLHSEPSAHKDSVTHAETPATNLNADTAPVLDPQPRMVPAPPGVVGPSAQRNATDALLDRFDREVLERDRSISSAAQRGIVAPASGDTPREIPGATTTEAEAVLKDHSESRRILRAALEQAVARGIRRATDVLDRGTVRAKAAQVTPLSASNHLAIAECWKDLATAPDGSSRSMQDLDAGLQALGSIDPTALDSAQQIRRVYLTLWFQAEALRRLPQDTAPEELAKRLAAARTLQQELSASAPGSPLAAAGEALFIGLQPTAPKP